MTDEEIYELARTEYMESGDREGEWWARAMRHHTRMVLDDLREWNKDPEKDRPGFRYAYFAADIDAYEKDQNGPE